MSEQHNKIAKCEEQDEESNILKLLQSIPKMLSDEAKIQKVNKIIEIIKQYGEDFEVQYITEEICNELLIQIDEGQTDIEKELLRIVSAIAELGVDTADNKSHNQFFDILENSNLIEWVKVILEHELELEEEFHQEKKYSKSIIQLTQIISFYYKGQINLHENLQQWLEILFNPITQMIESLEEYEKEQKLNEIETQKNNFEINKQIEENLTTMKAIYCLSENITNLDFLVEDIKVHDFITPLIHINCPSRIHCSQCITIPDSIQYQHLQEAAYRILGDLSYHPMVNHILVYHNSIIDHITPVIEAFASNYQNQTSQLHQLVQSSTLNISSDSNICVFNGALLLLQIIIVFDHSICQQIALSTNIIESLFILTQYSLQNKLNNQKLKQSVKIRVNILDCLDSIWVHNNLVIQIRMIDEYRYVKVLIEKVSKIRGNEIENDQVIKQSIMNIGMIFTQFHPNENERYLDLEKQEKVEIEEEGGSEEIQSYFFFSENEQNDEEMKQWSHNTMKRMLNAKKDFSNMDDEDFEDDEIYIQRQQQQQEEENEDDSISDSEENQFLDSSQNGQVYIQQQFNFDDSNEGETSSDLESDSNSDQKDDDS